jgi:hypothetical protein
MGVGWGMLLACPHSTTYRGEANLFLLCGFAQQTNDGRNNRPKRNFQDEQKTHYRMCRLIYLKKGGRFNDKHGSN